MAGLRLAAFRRSGNPWLTDPRFLAIFVVGTLTSTVRWLEMLAFGVYVFAKTQSATITAMMILLRIVPLALFGAFGGAVADRVDRRRLMQWGLVGMCVLSVGLAALAWSGRIEVWHLGVAAFLGGVFWITDFPFRRTLIGDVVRGPHLGRAMGVDTLANNGTRMLGPLMGGPCSRPSASRASSCSPPFSTPCAGSPSRWCVSLHPPRRARSPASGEASRKVSGTSAATGASPASSR